MCNLDGPTTCQRGHDQNNSLEAVNLPVRVAESWESLHVEPFDTFRAVHVFSLI